MKSTRLYGTLKEVKKTHLQGGRDNFSGTHTTPGLPDLLWWLVGVFSRGCYTKIGAE